MSHKLAMSLKDLQDKNGHIEHEFEREGKKVKVSEKTVWQEVFYGSQESEKFMREQYPDLFAIADEEKAVSKEVLEFELQNFGFRFSEMTMPKLIWLINGIWELREADK